MIDFLPPLTSNDYKVEKMLSTFYHGNKVTKYLAGIVMDDAVNRSNEGLKSKKVQLESLMKKLVQQVKCNSENSHLSDELVESKLEQTNPNYSKYRNQLTKIHKKLKNIQYKNHEEKRFFGKQVIAKLEKRFHAKGGISKLLQDGARWVQEQSESFKSIGLAQEYIEASLADLQTYIQGIQENYAVLKNDLQETNREEGSDL